jgi:hypothetical protein
MLQTLFYGYLRASELCNLNDEDLDLNNLAIRIVSGKGGRDGITYISQHVPAHSGSIFKSGHLFWWIASSLCFILTLGIDGEEKISTMS